MQSNSSATTSTYGGQGAWSSGENSHDGGDEEELHVGSVGLMLYLLLWKNYGNTVRGGENDEDREVVRKK